MSWTKNYKGNNKNWPLALIFLIINIHLVDINLFAKFDEIPSLPVQVINEKPKYRRLRITKGKRIGP